MLVNRILSVGLHDDRVTSLMMHPTADQFMSAGLDGTIRLWDIRNSDTSVRQAKSASD